MQTRIKRHSGDYFTPMRVSKELFNTPFEYFDTFPKGQVAETKSEKNTLDIYKMIAQTSTLALAIELLFKGLALKTNNTALNTHDLILLFEDLPSALKNDIQSIYSLSFKNAPDKKVTSYRFHLVPDHIKPSIEDDRRLDAIPDPKDNVLALLQLEKNAFLTWRYLHSNATPTGVFSKKIHFNHLIMLYRAIEQHPVVNSLFQRST